jgi:hypothetical protein
MYACTRRGFRSRRVRTLVNVAEFAPVDGSASGRTRAEHVVHEPLSLLLPDGSGPKQTALDEHVVCGLEDALQVRWVALCERELLSELVEPDAPGESSFGASDLEQSIQPPGHG